jgi:D-alanyl-D-alanine carboxypeptidase
LDNPKKKRYTDADVKTGLLLTALLFSGAVLTAQTTETRYARRLGAALAASRLPEESALRIKNNPAFPLALGRVLSGDPYLRLLVDKEHPLPSSYEPGDLVELRCKNFRASFPGTMTLRAGAEAALEAMAAEAAAAGFTFTVSSAYRSYGYQIGSFERWTQRLGQARAERVSAHPGISQHQLGLAVDFDPLSNEFAETEEGMWLKHNASRFGFSLSFPGGYEHITGYDRESWHYRFVGKKLAAFINAWFDGVQHYALAFLYAWENP